MILSLASKYITKNFILIEETLQPISSFINTRTALMDVVENLAACYAKILKKLRWYTFFLSPTDELMLKNLVKLHKTNSIRIVQEYLEKNIKSPQLEGSNVIPLRSFKLKPLPTP